MAFFLEDRDTKFLTENQTPNIGPGQYEKKSQFKPRQAKSQEQRFIGVKRPAFNQTTERQDLHRTNYNPPPGQYQANTSTFQATQIVKNYQDDRDVYKFKSNSNVVEKPQPYSVDKVQRFTYANTSKLNDSVGPGTYEPLEEKKRFEDEPPIKKIKRKLKESSKWPKTMLSVPTIPSGFKVLHLEEEDYEESIYYQKNQQQFEAINEESEKTPNKKRHQNPRSIDLRIQKRDSQGVETNLKTSAKQSQQISEMSRRVDRRNNQISIGSLLNNDMPSITPRQNTDQQQLQQQQQDAVQQEDHPTPHLEDYAQVYSDQAMLYSEAQSLKQKYNQQQQQYTMNNEEQEEKRESEKKIGPGKYNPNYNVVKKSTPSYNWGVSKQKRSQTGYKEARSMPGPGSYEQNVLSLGNNVKNISEEQQEMRKTNFNQYKLLQQKMHLEKFNYGEKIKRHMSIKNEAQQKIGPGMYYNPKTQSEFNRELKPEYLQFFGSTQERFRPAAGKQQNELGPGHYEPPSEFNQNNTRKAATASFKSQRKDYLFSGNELPGPGQYHQYPKDQMFAVKNWQTNIGAFGTTEKRFSQVAYEDNVPGPGDYRVQSMEMGRNYTVKRVRGKTIRVKSSGNCVFQSRTGRSLDQSLQRIQKLQQPGVGHYSSSSGIGQGMIQGGAPNNFLLMKNERHIAPFSSTVTRFNQQEQPSKLNMSLGPGTYQVEDINSISRIETASQSFITTKRSTFCNADRFQDQTKQKNFRIGPKVLGPGPTSYNKDSAFNKKSFNLRFLKQMQ